MIKIIVAFLFVSLSLEMQSQVFDAVVDLQGHGDYVSVQEALDAIPNREDAQRYYIFIRNGVYEEKVDLTGNMPSVSLIGENVESVIISWDDYQGKDGMSTARSYTFLAEGDDLYMENITIRNTYGTGAQAVAIRTTGDRQVFKNCHFYGNQDTYFANKNRQYNYKCLIEGNTDFIFGDATAVFDSCVIRSIPGGRYITAPADSKLITFFSTGNFYHGMLFRHCDIVPGEGVENSSVYLGRPWQEYASVAYIECSLGEHIYPQGWSQWSGNNNHQSAIFLEYKNVDANNELIDVTQRVEWSSQLTEDEVNRFYNLNFFFRKNLIVWNPASIVEDFASPNDVILNEGVVSWSPVTDAIGYGVFKDDALQIFTKELALDVNTEAALEDYDIYAFNQYGGYSRLGYYYTPSSIQNVEQKSRVKIIGNHVSLSDQAAISIYSYTGQLIHQINTCFECELPTLRSGIYLIHVNFLNGESATEKIIVN